MKKSRVLQTFLQFFPTSCVHCNNITDSFELPLCFSCFQEGMSSDGVWKNKYWKALDNESPFVSLWRFAKNKEYRKPIKNLAAICAAKWAASSRPLPEIISYIPSKEDVVGNDKSCEQLAFELANFFHVDCEKVVNWKIDAQVFDAKGNILAELFCLSKIASIKDKMCLFVCENEQKIAVELLKEHGLQNMWVLQLIE